MQEMYSTVKNFAQGVLPITHLSLKQEAMEEIELQALRVKLISNSLKNPKKDHTVLETEYNEKIEKKETRLLTEPNGRAGSMEFENFREKWKNLDG